MQLCKARQTTGEAAVGVVSEGRVHLLRRGGASGPNTLSGFLHADDPAALVAAHLDASDAGMPLDSVTLLPPLDEQEVWAAGVTYKRSREARERESAGAARFYDLVYNAERPELFLKATPRRVVGPGAAVRIRHDSRWNVPEPELGPRRVAAVEDRRLHHRQRHEFARHRGRKSAVSAAGQGL